MLTGAAVFPFAVKSEGVNNVAGLARWLRQKKITLYVSVPVLFRLLTKGLGKNGTLPDMRLIRLSGDRILPSDIELFKKHFARSCVLRAAYGSSESNLATQFFIDHAYDGARDTVPAGYPLPDAEVFIVDDQLNRLGAGEQGEIAAASRYHADGDRGTRSVRANGSWSIARMRRSSICRATLGLSSRTAAWFTADAPTFASRSMANGSR